ncbi:hypothetical protein CU102_24640 [Phyllobacterium brassicacearum]|uniref:DUF4175 domain-containing protein n=1 Tax=Phyllobacterium brassicacearum TaxID=314235 RepID=A0A2P7B8Y2_9HYPH|nr:hypothetical protein [Phyllobacterium brassicacearum]PSH62930.1 hypothetical protein CU102_24640 [Phyllobacterium brassicacearum]TDQ13653.1 hypothetical protein DEV91_14012 [Phyllobacterium brassicacearum]
MLRLLRILVAALVVGLAVTPQIFAADTDQAPGSKMGTGMMEQGGMMNMMSMMQQMNQMMESCNKMMQKMDAAPTDGQHQKKMPAQPDTKE